MNPHFYIFLTVFVVTLFVAVKIYHKMKVIIDDTYQKEEEILATTGMGQISFHRHIHALMFHIAQVHKADAGILKFIYRYIKNILPEQQQVSEIDYFYSTMLLYDKKNVIELIDLKKTKKKGVLVVYEDNLKKVGTLDERFNIRFDFDFCIGLTKAISQHISQVGRKYIMYLLYKTTCAASSPNFTSMSELCQKGLNFNSTDIEELINCGKDNRLSEWYEQNILCDTQKAYKPIGVLSDLLYTEFPTLPPYNFRDEPVRRANWWSLLFYLNLFGLSFYTMTSFNSYNLSLLLILPWFANLIAIICSFIYIFFVRVFLFEDNRINSKPTTIHLVLGGLTFGLSAIFFYHGLRELIAG